MTMTSRMAMNLASLAESIYFTAVAKNDCPASA
jgi:hypothetical protein